MKFKSVSSILALAFAILASAQVQAQPESMPTPPMSMDGDTSKHHEGKMGMMEMHQAMLAEMKAQDAALADKVAEMNIAPGEQKINLLASIVTTLVEQRAAMTARMEKMQGGMMMMPDEMRHGERMESMAKDSAVPKKEKE